MSEVLVRLFCLPSLRLRNVGVHRRLGRPECTSRSRYRFAHRTQRYPARVPVAEIAPKTSPFRTSVVVVRGLVLPQSGQRRPRSCHELRTPVAVIATALVGDRHENAIITTTLSRYYGPVKTQIPD
jgi:hypothetical protein